MRLIISRLLRMKALRAFGKTLPLTALFALTAACAPCAAFAQTVDNGIVVGQAKLYDERSLESLLGAIQSGLNGQNGSGVNYVNPTTIAAHEGYLQGGVSSANATTASLGQANTFPPAASTTTPATTTSTTTGTTTPTTAAATPAYSFLSPGVPAANTSTSPTSVWQTNGANAAGLSGSVAVGSEDMLLQQVGLSFQATNLALLLQHSVSDRLIFEQGKPLPRALAVLGFQITVESSMENKNCVAVADITVADPTGFNEAPQVVMMLPQDKTYNVAKVTNDSRTLGLGSFAAPIFGSASNSSSHGSAYAVYDVDTVALQRPQDPSSHSVTFSWEFRPVLGEQAVEPGTRQVYVLLSLPISASQTDSGSQIPSTPFTPLISVKTCWRKMDTKSKTVDMDDQRQVSTYDLTPLPIYDMDTYEDGLEPIIENVDWHDAGNNQMYIEAEGANFTEPVSVILDGEADGLAQECGGRLLSFSAPLAALRYEDPVVIGAYGLPVTLAQPDLKDASNQNIEPSQPGEGMRINNIAISPLDANDSLVRIQLVAKKTNPTDESAAPRLPSNAQLIIAIGDQVYGLNDTPIGEEKAALLPDNVDFVSPPAPKAGSDDFPTFDIHVPNSVLCSAQKVTVRYLFAGGDKYKNDYRCDCSLPSSTFTVDSVTVVSKSGQQIVLAIKGDLPTTLTASVNDTTFHPSPAPSGAYLQLQAPASSATFGSKPGRFHPKRHGPKRNTPKMAMGGFPAPMGGGGTRGATPVYTEPSSDIVSGAQGGAASSPAPTALPSSPSSYSIALLYAKPSQLRGAEYILLYQPGDPAQLLSLSDCLKDIDGIVDKAPELKPHPGPRMRKKV